MSNRYMCIHAHFYQPPRENPWLEAIELQDSAYPFHDWNERITEECYAPNTASRILGDDHRIIDIVNNYSRISFNFGPTLLSWLETHRPKVYQDILDADRMSREKFNGHGSALAQCYNHIIMPLADETDRRTQVTWGIRDFEHRFGRKPEGMWLPETAVDIPTLELLAEYGIGFTILAPRQAKRVRPLEGGDGEWEDVSDESIDPKMPYRCILPSGKTIDLFFYDGPVSQGIAFEGLLKDGSQFAERLTGAFSGDEDRPQLVHIATDGESYGHHHRYGDMALSYCLHQIESNGFAEITIYARYLELHPPEKEVEIVENSSWSCVHGVERWRADCGCHTGGHENWTQAWRQPLRQALDDLRDTLRPFYEQSMKEFADDPWAVRNDYISVILDRSAENVDAFLEHIAGGGIDGEQQRRILKLLEMQRHMLLMYTSCGWFFDEISGIETVQVMQYASRVMQLARELGAPDPEPAFLEKLSAAPSNIDMFDNGADVYAKNVRTAVVGLPRVAAHYAASSVFEEYPETMQLHAFAIHLRQREFHEAGINKLLNGWAVLRSDITREEFPFTFAVLHFGDHNLTAGIRAFGNEETSSAIRANITDAFMRSDISEAIRRMNTDFEGHNYSLWHLFRDEQRKVMDIILAAGAEEIESSFRQIYEYRYPVMQAMREMNIPLPEMLSMPVRFILNHDIMAELKKDEPDVAELGALIEQFRRLGLEPDYTLLSFEASRTVNEQVDMFLQSPDNLSMLHDILSLLEALEPFSLDLDIWESQTRYFSVAGNLQADMAERAEQGDKEAREWIGLFGELASWLNIGGA